MNLSTWLVGSVMAGAVVAGSFAVEPEVRVSADAAHMVIAHVDIANAAGGVTVDDLLTGTRTVVASDLQAASPALSPDGSTVAFTARPTDSLRARESEIFTVKTDGSAVPQQLTSNVSCLYRHPAWSPDGTVIAVSCGTTDPQIYLLDASTGDFLKDVGAGDDVSFAPDGTKLVVGGSGDMTVIDLASGARKVLGRGLAPKWSPDGESILYGSIETYRRLWTIDPDGTNARMLAGATTNSDDAVTSWAWSGDSGTIAETVLTVDSNNTAGNADLFLTDGQGTTRTAIAPTTTIDETAVSAVGSVRAAAPPAPTDVTAVMSTPAPGATPDSSAVEVSWTAPVDDVGAPITGYAITPFHGATELRTRYSTGDAEHGVVTGLPKAQAYTFQVAAIDLGGTGARSLASAPLAVPATAPGVPAAPQVSAEPETAIASWAPPSDDGGSPITAYTATAVTTAGQAAGTCTTTGATTCRIGGLVDGTVYSVQVFATNAVGSGAPSLPSGAIEPCTTPGAAGRPEVTAGDGSAALTWAAPATDGGSPVLQYLITPSISGAAQVPVVTPGSATSYTVDGLEDGTAYTFTITAVNGKGNGPDSPSSLPVTPRAPTTLSETAPNTVIVAGATAVITGRLIRTDSATAVEGQTVRLQFRPVSSAGAYSTFGTVQTASNGVATFRGFKPASAVQVRLLSSAAGAYGASTSPVRTVAVARRITVASTVVSVRKGRSFTIHGAVAPASPQRSVMLQRRSGTTWRTIATGPVTAKSTYAFTRRATTVSTALYRVVMRRDASFSASAGPQVRVRTTA